VTEAHVPRADLEQPPAAQPGMTVSSNDVLTRVGTTDTSSTNRRDASSSRDALPSTALAIDGGSSVAAGDASSSVT
jgi:hypothetical protein